jgi:hypothetical protein
MSLESGMQYDGIVLWHLCLSELTCRREVGEGGDAVNKASEGPLVGQGVMLE